MVREIITDELTQQILQALEKEVALSKKTVTFEIQDDGQCIMIYIAMDDIPHCKHQANFERVRQILNQMVPGRDCDYSWFATFTIGDHRVDSCFGGNLDFPTSIF